MRSAEIPEEEWVRFFDRFSREREGWPVTIEVLSEVAGPQKAATELPLQGISFEPSGSRPCTVQVSAGGAPGAHVSHVVDLPLHIRVADDEGGARGTIQIEPARGPATLIHYHGPA
jgi:hypothetical protein